MGHPAQGEPRPVKIAILSDIHGNEAALEAVLRDIEQVSADETISVGDNIGYGPDSNAVMTRLAQLHVPSVMGNHEMPVTDRRLLDWFNPIARASLEIILESLTEPVNEMIRRLPRFLVRHGVRFVHGFPPDSPTRYLYQIKEKQLIQYFSGATERICFIGHTHELFLVTYDGIEVSTKSLSKGRISLSKPCFYIVNAGSVGQPRDGNNNAKYILWNTELDTLEVRFVPYDIQQTADRIMAAGLPERNARRLF